MTRYVIRGGREGYERLKVLADARRPDTQAFLDRIGVAPGLRCVDLGCGGGDVTLELARRVGPDGGVVGVDMDEVKLRLAREDAAARGLSNVEFRREDLSAWAEPGAFDLAYARNVLQHLVDPVGLLRRMWAAVRPGGVVAVEDADFGGLFCDPPNEGFDLYARCYTRVLERRGGDPAIGRKLHRCFRDAGMPAPEVALAHTAHASGDGKALALLSLDAIAAAVLAEGIASEEELRAGLSSLEAFTADPGTVVAEPRIFQAWSRRPVDGAAA